MDGNKRFYTNYEMSDILHRLAIQTPGAYGAQDYGTGEKYTAVEVHMVSYIADHPNCTGAEISKAWGRTRGATSQIVRKLRENQLIEEKIDPEHNKRVFLTLTPKGRILDAMHRQSDGVFFAEVLALLQEDFSTEEVDKAFMIMEKIFKIIMQQ